MVATVRPVGPPEAVASALLVAASGASGAAWRRRGAQAGSGSRALLVSCHV